MRVGDVLNLTNVLSRFLADSITRKIKQCLNKPEIVGVLLEHTVGNLDPLYIVNILPSGLEVPQLRNLLVKIITDYKTEKHHLDMGLMTCSRLIVLTS
ncbi:hypothetical protein SLA2020_245420 [Shorea laevis]